MRSVKKADQCELDRPQGQEEEHKHTLRRVVAKKQRQQRVQSTLQRVTTAIQLTQCGLSVYSPLLLHENHRCFPGPFTWHCCVPFAFSTASASAVAARSESTLCPIPTKKERHHTHTTSHHTHTHAPTRARAHTHKKSAIACTNPEDQPTVFHNLRRSASTMHRVPRSITSACFAQRMSSGNLRAQIRRVIRPQ